jgi:hypothetical protein
VPFIQVLIIEGFQVTLGLRVFAMYGSDLRVLALMTVPGTATVALIIVCVISTRYS